MLVEELERRLASIRRQNHGGIEVVIDDPEASGGTYDIDEVVLRDGHILLC